MAFGINQINKPTPQWANVAAKVFTVVSGVFLTWMATSSLIPAGAKNEIAGIIGAVNTILHLLAPLFGIQIDAATVPTSQVTAIKSEPEKAADATK